MTLSQLTSRWTLLCGRGAVASSQTRQHPDEATQSISAVYAVLIFLTVAAIAFTTTTVLFNGIVYSPILSRVNHHSSANAKAHLSHSVDNCDVEVAVKLINFRSEPCYTGRTSGLCLLLHSYWSRMNLNGVASSTPDSFQRLCGRG